MSKIKTPVEIYGPLFKAIHASGLFSDGKTISDLVPLKKPSKILKKYMAKRDGPDFDLSDFVNKYFRPTAQLSSKFKSDTSKTVEEHINSLWTYLLKEADAHVKGSSKILLPYPYIVPGGRFQEIYYWDSYFTMLGLVASGQVDIVESMCDNFAYLIKTIGHIPNGNRTYFLSRSQPPFFACMVELLAEQRGKKIYRKYLPALRAEYKYWMKGQKKIRVGEVYKKLVKLKGGVLNRYYDDSITPREEMYQDDVDLQEESGRNAALLFSDLRAACESGWDFSSRWLSEVNELASIRTSDIIPIDLNCLLYKLESVLSRAYKLAGDKGKQKKYKNKAQKRKGLIYQYLWNDDLGCFNDYHIFDEEPSDNITAAIAYPLFFKLATKEQAVTIKELIENKLLRPGGIVTTPINSGQQWDAPNGWAPLQWITIQGLRNYGYDELAREVRSRWIKLNTSVYKRTGKLLEKYDVEDLSKLSGGGEYPVQDGFGWTNGVLLKLLSE